MAVVQSEGVLVAAMAPWTPNFGISSGITTYGGEFSDYAAVFRTQPNVRLVISFLARNIAHLNLKAFRAVSDTERQALARAHPLSRMIRSPNPYTTRHRFVDALVHDRKVYDNFFALKVRRPTDGQLQLFRIPPYMIEPIGSGWFRPDGWRLIAGTDRPEFPVDAVLHLRGYNPSDARLGHSPIETIRRILAEEIAAGEWREQYWRGAARMSGIIERPQDAPPWSPTARNRFRDDWRAAYAGNSELAAATPVLEEGMVWKEAGFSPKDSEYLGARILARGECAAQYHVSPLFVGILENANFSNVAEQHKHLYQDTLGPDLDEYEEDFALQLLPEFPDLDPDEVYFEFNLAEKLKGTFEEQASVLSTSTGAPWLTRNEARARSNLPPLAGGDELVTPLNVLVGGQASPQDGGPPAGGQAGRKASELLVKTGQLLGLGSKSVDDLPQEVRGWAAKHEEVVGRFFTRQKAAVMSRLGAGQTVGEAFDMQRWNGELHTDLLALSTSMAADVAGQVADRFGGTYDEALAFGWLDNNARIAAENTNNSTFSSLVAAFAPTTGTASRSKDISPTLDLSEDEELDSGLPDPLAAATGVFESLIAGLAILAISRVTSIGNFARQEGASQAGVRSKVWVVNSANSRHPELDGETVPMGEPFSNGGMWPGDPSLGADQVAGCTCSLDFTTEAA